MTAAAAVSAGRTSPGLDHPTLAPGRSPLLVLVATILLPYWPRRHTVCKLSQPPPPPPPPTSALLNSSSLCSGCRRAAHSTATSRLRPCSPPSAPWTHLQGLQPPSRHRPPASWTAAACWRAAYSSTHSTLCGPAAHETPPAIQRPYLSPRAQHLPCTAHRDPGWPWHAPPQCELLVQPCNQGTSRFMCPPPSLGVKARLPPPCRHASHVPGHAEAAQELAARHVCKDTAVAHQAHRPC